MAGLLEASGTVLTLEGTVHTASLAQILGPSFAQDDIPQVIQKLVDVHLENRQGEERFIDTYRRLGVEPYKEAVYSGWVI